ncbi:proteoglycan 4-like isoform X1 [Labrus mixtus]|uniref:proteoglycan 4-like isoform X1 n=1 Tax=Labrus mixtus TaxID=508554 RepID=UPI0029C01436|nr:proteoglycan 4-like isoform X1 [Labrus mixtus]
MSSATLCAVVLLLCALTFSAAQSSCRGRCGSEYYRGNMCQCDYNCLSYGECCKDFESQCTTSDSCKGRCGEDFKRGRLCSCDSNCEKYKQCCSDFDHHCDALEEISGATSETAPGKTSSCHNVNNNKPKEPPQSGATDVSSTFSEGDNTDDHLIPLVSPTSYPQDDLNDDIFPNDEYSDDGFGDLEATPIPESTSGYGSSTADLLDQLPTEPTQNPDTVETTTETVTADALTQTTLADNEPTQADSSPSTIPPTMDEVPTISTDAGDPTSSGTTPPQPTTAAVSSLPVANSEHPRGDSPGPNNPEPVTEATSKGAVSPDGQNTDPTVISINEPEDTTLSLNTTYNPTEASVSTVTTQDPTPIPMTATSAPGPDVDNKEDVATELPTSLPDLEDPSIGVTPSDSRKPSEPDALTVNIPTSTEASRDAPTEDQARTTADPLNVPADPTKPTRLEETSKPQDKPKPVKPIAAKPSSKPETKPLDPAQTLNVDNPRDYQADDSNDTNLCSGRPVSGVTTLRNGTIVVFRGHYFWVLDRNRVPGQAQDITQVWGVPSPIDTVFTRCNCQGKTYIFRGPQYWRYENDVLDSGYPKVIETGFDGLRGHITAALSVPQYQRRRESVYFFKRGGNVQKYSYQFGTSPKCGRKPQYAIYTVSNRIVRQAVSALGGTINIRTSWRGFPPTITAAVSIPSYREPEGYKYYVVSRSKSYKVRMDTGRPEIPAPAANTSPQSNVFKCPKKL